MKRTPAILLTILIVLAACCGAFLLGYTIQNNTQNDASDLLPVINHDDNQTIYVVGHKNTDMDTVCSAIGLAEFLQKCGINATAAVCSDICPEARYILDRCGKEYPVLLQNASGKLVFLVDHNLLEQGAEGLDSAVICGIIDHHNLGGLSTSSPEFLSIEPVGSTASIITKLYSLFDVDMEPGTAALLLAAVLDDTRNLRLTTTCDLDRTALETLKTASGISDTDAVYSAICTIETTHDGQTDSEILHADEKPYTMDGKRIFISDVKVAGTEAMETMKERMKDAVAAAYPTQGAVHLYVIVSDMDGYTSELLYYGDGAETIVREAFPVTSDGRVVFSHVVTRKSDIVPALENAYEKLSG